jgi:hypothetical protein
MQKLLKFAVRHDSAGQIKHAKKLRDPNFLKFYSLQEPFAVETMNRWKLAPTGGNKLREKQLLALKKSKKPFLVVTHVDRMHEYYLLRRILHNNYHKDDLLDHWVLFWHSQLEEKSQHRFTGFKAKNGSKNDLDALKTLYDKKLYMVVDYPNFIRQNRFNHKKFIMDKGAQFRLGKSQYTVTDNELNEAGSALSHGQIKNIMENRNKKESDQRSWSDGILSTNIDDKQKPALYKTQANVFGERFITVNTSVPVDDDLDIITSCLVNRCMLFSSDLYRDVYDNFGNFLVSTGVSKPRITELLLQYRLLMHFARRHILTPHNFMQVAKPDIYLLPGIKKVCDMNRNEQKNYPYSEEHYKARQVDALIILNKNRTARLKKEVDFIKRLPEGNETEKNHKKKFKMCLNYYSVMTDEFLDNYLVK